MIKLTNYYYLLSTLTEPRLPATNVVVAAGVVVLVAGAEKMNLVDIQIRKF